MRFRNSHFSTGENCEKVSPGGKGQCGSICTENSSGGIAGPEASLQKVLSVSQFSVTRWFPRPLAAMALTQVLTNDCFHLQKLELSGVHKPRLERHKKKNPSPLPFPLGLLYASGTCSSLNSAPEVRVKGITQFLLTHMGLFPKTPPSRVWLWPGLAYGL